MYPTSAQTALMLALVLNRSEQSRARVSAKTIKVLAKRSILRSAFVIELTTYLSDYGWIFFELASGGYGAVQTKALEAAKPVTAKRYLQDKEKESLRNGVMDFDKLERELMTELDEPTVDD